MSAIKLAIFLLSVFKYGGAYSECSDCMIFKACPGALRLALLKQGDKLFQAAFCGYGYDSEERTDIPKVCCSQFPKAEADSLENHRNVKLLADSCGDISGDKIVGGTVAGLYEFPWMALISHRTREGLQFKCGGSVINSRYVLTAAHCVADKIIAGVRIGEHDINNTVDCQKGVCEHHYWDIGVEKKVTHEDYRGLPVVANDIALLRLKKNIDFSYKNARPICLPVTARLRGLNVSGRTATVAGWGITETGYESSILRKVDVPVLTGRDCSGYYKNNPSIENFREFCAGVVNKDSCSGDSGGPLMVEERYNDVLRKVQYGIVSHGPRQCGSTHPGVYTDVTKFMDWILDNLES